jgi:hypothetical protein
MTANNLKKWVNNAFKVKNKIEQEEGELAALRVALLSLTQCIESEIKDKMKDKDNG